MCDLVLQQFALNLEKTPTDQIVAIFECVLRGELSAVQLSSFLSLLRATHMDHSIEVISACVAVVRSNFPLNIKCREIVLDIVGFDEMSFDQDARFVRHYCELLTLLLLTHFYACCHFSCPIVAQVLKRARSFK